MGELLVEMSRADGVLRADQAEFLGTSVAAIGATLDSADVVGDASAQYDGRLLAMMRRAAALRDGQLMTQNEGLDLVGGVGASVQHP